MQKLQIDDYIETRLDEQIAYYTAAATKAKKRYLSLKAIEIACAALVPFLSAMIDAKNVDTMKIVVGFAGVSISVLSGALLLFKFHENWVKYRGTAESLKSERYLFLMRSGIYKGKGATSALVERIESIIGDENKQWQSYTMEHKEDEIIDNANMVIASTTGTATVSNSRENDAADTPPATEKPASEK